MADDTLVTTQRKPEYIEAREKALFDQLFGTLSPDGTFSGGLLDPKYVDPETGEKPYEDLFTIPDYEIADQTGRDAEGDITGLGPETYAYEVMMTDANNDGIPDWLGRSQDYFDKSKDLLGIGEDADGAQQQFTAAGDVLSDAQGYYGAVGEGDKSAVDLLQAGAGAYDPTSGEYGVSKYMSPYEDAVLATMEKDIERQGDVARKKSSDQAIRAGAFGGSRQGIQAAEVERNILDAKAKASANVRSKAYENALNASMTGFEKGQQRNLDAGRLMGGLGQSYGGIGTALGGLGSDMVGAAGTSADVGRVFGAQSPADLTYMAGVGQQERQYRQDMLDTQRMNAMLGTEQALMPISYTMGLLQGTPSAGVTNSYRSQYGTESNPMVAGLGMYTAMQGINS